MNAGNAGSLGLDSFLCAPPLALMYLAPTVPDHGKLLVDLKLNPNVSEDTLRRVIRRHDLVAISSYTPSIKSAIHVATLAKECGKPVVIGGYHASLVPEVVMDPAFDVAVQSEGELTFPEIVSILERDGAWTPGALRGVKGISYRDGDRLVVNEPRPLVKDLDTLPFPDRTLIGNTRYEYFGSSIDAIETSRGCVGSCNFCCVKEHTPAWRKKSPERVIEEMTALNPRARWIAYQDSEFTINMDRVARICDLIVDHGFDHRWHAAQVRADDLVRDKRTFGRMVDAGFKMLFIGIESVHQRSLDGIGKRLSVDTVRQAVKMCHDHGVTVLGAIIIGNIGETYQDVLQTIAYAKQLDVDIGQFTALTPLPKTGLWDLANERGWIEDRDWTHYDFSRVVMRTPDLTRLQIAGLVRKAYRDFYLGGYWGSYFFSKAKRFTSNRRYWWFFKMLPGFMKNIKPIKQMIEDLSNPPPVVPITSAPGTGSSKIAVTAPGGQLHGPVPVVE